MNKQISNINMDRKSEVGVSCSFSGNFKENGYVPKSRVCSMLISAAFMAVGWT